VPFVFDRFLLLPLGPAFALVWANTAGESYFRFAHRLAFPVNEVAMALFFGLLTQEVWLLPELPSEPEYRIVGRDLALWDEHAALIVDIIPGAFPELSFTRARIRPWRPVAVHHLHVR
jgi:hypothetical protein